MSLTEKEEVLGILIERSLNKNDHVCFDDDCEIDHPYPPPRGKKLGKQNLQNGLWPGSIVFSFNLSGQLILKAIQNKTSQVLLNLLQNIAILKLQWLDSVES